MFNKTKPFLIGFAIYFIYQLTNIGCPIRYLTGIPCPGCGMSRAMYQLHHGNFQQAFYYHPLFPLVFVFLLIYPFQNKLSTKTKNTLLYLLATIFILTYLLRIFYYHSAITTPNLQEGLLYKLLKRLIP